MFYIQCVLYEIHNILNTLHNVHSKYQNIELTSFELYKVKCMYSKIQ